MPLRQLEGTALLAVLVAVALTGCGGGGGGGQTPTTPVTPPPPPPPPVFSLAVDTAPEPAVGIVGHPSDSVARASLVFRYTVDQTGQDDRAWSIPDVSLCEESESGESHCFTVTAEPATGTVAENTPVTVALELTCDRAVTWQAPVEILLGEDNARATVTWDVSCEVPQSELIGVEIYQGPFVRAWSGETGEWTWHTPPRIPWYAFVEKECGPNVPANTLCRQQILLALTDDSHQTDGNRVIDTGGCQQSVHLVNVHRRLRQRSVDYRQIAHMVESSQSLLHGATLMWR